MTTMTTIQKFTRSMMMLLKGRIALPQWELPHGRGCGNATVKLKRPVMSRMTSTCGLGWLLVIHGQRRSGGETQSDAALPMLNALTIRRPGAQDKLHAGLTE